jgi:hypothetical protein
VARQPTALGAHPLGEFIDQGCDTVLAGRAAVVGGKPVDLALDSEDRVDAVYDFDRQRRLSQIGQLEEVAAAVAPASRLSDRSWPALGIVELGETGIGVGLEDSGIAS